MSDGKISFMIGCGWFAAGIGAIAGAVYNPGGATLSYLVAAIFFILAAGIFARIDWCAIIALVIFIALRIQFYEVAVAIQQHAGNGQVILGFWLSAIIFTQLYILGVIGTLLWNARHPEVRYSIVAVWRRMRGEVNPGLERRSP
jgi:hypothetical protein